MTTVAAPSRTGLGIAAALTTVAIWATWMLGTRATVSGDEGVEPIAASFIRFIVTCVLLAPWWMRTGPLPRGVSAWTLVGLLFAGAPYVWLVSWGLRLTPAAEAGPLLSGTVPLFVAAMAIFFLRERLRLPQFVGLLFIAAGVAVIVGNSIGKDEGSAGWGHLIMLGSSLTWAIYTVSFRRSGLDALSAAGVISLWSLAMLAPFFVSHIWPALQAMSWADIAFQALIQGLLGGIAAMVTYGSAVKHLGASRASAITAATPAVGLIAAIPILGESPDALTIAGCAASVLGVLLASGSFSQETAS